MQRHLIELLEAREAVFAPLVLNPLMARFAEAAGFDAGYVGGGAMGFTTCATEANLSLTQMLHAGLEIRGHARMPLILDGTCGWGDPMHVRHTVEQAEAAGFEAIEIEDQILPKRAHHHIGIEHVIARELMEAKIREAVAARRDPRFLVIARTNAARVESLDEALVRAEICRRAGADVLLVMPRSAADLRVIGERLPPPLMCMVPVQGISGFGMSQAELAAQGFKLIVDPVTPLLAMTAALRRCYEALRNGESDPTVGADAPAQELAILDVIGLDAMLEIERRTVESAVPAGAR